MLEYPVRFNNEMLRVHVIIMSEKRRRMCASSSRQLFVARAGTNIVAIKAVLYDRATYITHEECKRIRGVPFFFFSFRADRRGPLFSMPGTSGAISTLFLIHDSGRPAGKIPSSERRGRSIFPHLSSPKYKRFSPSSLLLLTKVYRRA